MPVIPRFSAKPADTPTAPPPIPIVKAVAPELLFALIVTSLRLASFFALFPQPIRVELVIRACVLLSSILIAIGAPTPTAPAAPTETMAFIAAAEDVANMLAEPLPVDLIFVSLICAVTERCNQLKFKAGATPTPPEPATEITSENMPFFALNKASTGSTLS